MSTDQRPVHRTSLFRLFRKFRKTNYQKLELNPEQPNKPEEKPRRKWFFKKKPTVTLGQETESITDPLYICPGCYTLTVPTDECQICLEDHALSSFPVLSLSCTHPARCCKSCLPDYFRSTQRNHGLDFRCPVGGCTVSLGFDDIKRLAPQEVFAKHDRQLKRQFLSNIPGWMFCSKDGCDFGIEFPDRRDGDYMNCIACGTKTCATCEVSHEGVTCRQFRRGETADDARRQENRRAELWVTENARECPGCKRMGVRESGCNHMTCQWCRTEYCWTCMRVYGQWPGRCSYCIGMYA